MYSSLFSSVSTVDLKQVSVGGFVLALIYSTNLEHQQYTPPPYCRYTCGANVVRKCKYKNG